jgi:hypothetical protein
MPVGIVVAQLGIDNDLIDDSPFIKTPGISIGVNVRFLYTTVSGITTFTPVTVSSMAYSLQVKSFIEMISYFRPSTSKVVPVGVYGAAIIVKYFQ